MVLERIKTMATDLLKNPIFNAETAAREWLEARVWPEGPTCPHCGNADQGKIRGLQGKAHRPGLYQCAECREQFTVTVKTVFERSKIPLTKWLAALFLMTASKKGVSAHQVHAWHQLQVNLVHDAPLARSHALRWARAARRARQSG